MMNITNAKIFGIAPPNVVHMLSSLQLISLTALDTLSSSVLLFTIMINLHCMIISVLSYQLGCFGYHLEA